MSQKTNAFFMQEEDIFYALPPARGPWSSEHCHAGPVTGLIARAVEQVVGEEKQLTRLTADLLRQSPMSGLRVEANVTRNGRRVATAIATVTDLDGRVCATATSMHIANNDVGNVKTAAVPKLLRSEATDGAFPVEEAAHNQLSFSHFTKVAFPQGETAEPGPTTLWMKTVPLLAHEQPTSFQRLCPLADCGNGTSRNMKISEMGFMNTDITIVAHRQTTSEWLASSAISHWHSSGLGHASAVIQDEEGVVASVLQTIILTPSPLSKT